jgi:hypothetical protein
MSEHSTSDTPSSETGETTVPAAHDADAGGGAHGHTAGDTPAARVGETGGEAGAATPIVTPEQLAAWKDGVRKSIQADLRKSMKAEQDAARAKEQGDYKALWEAAEAEKVQLAETLRARDFEAMRTRIAAKHGLPGELAARLAGDDEAALELDARALAKLVGPRVAPDTEAGAGARGGGAKVSMQPGYAQDGRPGLVFPGKKTG